jgi:hypothetical protein
MTTVTIDTTDYTDLLARVERAEGLLAGITAELRRYATPTQTGPAVMPEGDLRRMFEQGVNKPGDQYRAVVGGKTITAVINNVGAIVVNGTAWHGPSPAMKSATGTQQNGFQKFFRVRDNVRMHELRNQAREREGLEAVVWS